MSILAAGRLLACEKAKLADSPRQAGCRVARVTRLLQDNSYEGAPFMDAQRP